MSPLRTNGQLGVTATIGQRRLDELEAKERAHDAYRAACRYMSKVRLHINSETAFAQGYRKALADFDQAILAGVAEEWGDSNADAQEAIADDLVYAPFAGWPA